MAEYLGHRQGNRSPPVPRVIITKHAARGLERCRRFLAGKNPRAARRAAQAIGRQFTLLETNPDIGRLLTDHAVLRELIIRFGDSGYIALYRYELELDVVYVLAFRHQKEAGL